MGRITVIRAAAVAALALGLGGASALDAQESEPRTTRRVRGESIDTTFSLGAGGSLAIEMPHIGRGSADVTVTGWEGSTVRVRGETSDGELTVITSGSSVEIGTRSSGGMTRVERLDVDVPFGTRVHVNNGNGDVEITGTRGPVEATTFNGDITLADAADRVDVRTFNGDISLTNVAGRLSVAASNGDVQLRDIRGEVQVGTLSGDIELTGITSSSVNAKTMSGRIGYDGTIERTGDYSFNAFSGEIDIAIPRDAGASLTVSTFSGSIDSPDFPLTLKPGTRSRESKGQSMTFDLGTGGARISLESFSGEITIRARGADRRGG